MRVLFFSTMTFEQEYFEKLNDNRFELHFSDAELNEFNISLAKGFDAICIFVNDKLTVEIATRLKEYGIKIVALRCAGFNNVDLAACKENDICVVRVPEYSPYAVAEHTVALLLGLNRKIHKAYNRVREGNFSLNGLIGFDIHGKTVGVIGTGKIGRAFCRIMLGFGAQVICFDLEQSKELQELGATYVKLEEIWKNSDIISLHIPLNKSTHHLVDEKSIGQMKDSAVLVNTSRGGLIDTKALITALKSKKLSGAALDVYEEEDKLFFHDLSASVIQDDDIMRLMTFPNVLITAHQAFLTNEALEAIVSTTFSNLELFFSGRTGYHQV